MLRHALQQGWRDALVKHGLAQPSLGSVGIKAPVKAPGLPTPGKVSMPKPNASSSMPMPTSTSPAPSLGLQAAKVAANVGLMASTSSDGAGATRGTPADEGRRQRSVIDRTFQANEDNFATSSMPLPGSVVSP